MLSPGRIRGSERGLLFLDQYLVLIRSYLKFLVLKVVVIKC
jgi:hypothetical protein